MNRFYKRLSNWYLSTKALPYWAILLIDLLAIFAAGVVSDYLFTDARALYYHFGRLVTTQVCLFPLFLVGMRLFHTYSGIFRYSSFVDLMRVSCANLVGSCLSAILLLILSAFHTDWLYLLPVRVQISTFFIATAIMCAVRILSKYFYDTLFRHDNGKSVFVYGVRHGGIGLAKSLRNEYPPRYIVKGFVSEDPAEQNRFILGTSVYASNAELLDVMEEKGARTIIVSPLCADKFRENQELVNLLTKAGIRILMLRNAESWNGHGSVDHKQLQEVDIEDLLPRDKIQVDMEAIGRMLRGKRILITGAAGSIGSEMVRQVARFQPAELVLIDQAETPMHDVRRFMANEFAYIPCLTIVNSICHQSHMEQIFREHRPEYVFHAAAYKHVPMMEDNPSIAVFNNVYGTRVIADLAVKYGTEKFVMISTDKAVNPTNVMGCSKRICEIYCQALNKAIQDGTYHVEGQPADVKPHTQFITTRFGNVLGSNGSVIPIFKEQIRKGGPVTVTHPDIIRFFMLIPEACQLVLEAGTMGHGGEIFIFDMGKPVRIADLAQRMIDLSGAQGVQVKFTGLRDGEKLYEEVLAEAEANKPTVHPKIQVASVREYPYELALRNELELTELALSADDMSIVRKMKEIVPEYKSQHSKYQVLDK